MARSNNGNGENGGDLEETLGVQAIEFCAPVFLDDLEICRCDRERAGCGGKCREKCEQVRKADDGAHVGNPRMWLTRGERRTKAGTSRACTSSMYRVPLHILAEI